MNGVTADIWKHPERQTRPYNGTLWMSDILLKWFDTKVKVLVQSPCVISGENAFLSWLTPAAALKHGDGRIMLWGRFSNNWVRTQTETLCRQVGRKMWKH